MRPAVTLLDLMRAIVLLALPKTPPDTVLTSTNANPGFMGAQNFQSASILLAHTIASASLVSPVMALPAKVALTGGNFTSSSNYLLITFIMNLVTWSPQPQDRSAGVSVVGCHSCHQTLVVT